MLLASRSSKTIPSPAVSLANGGALKDAANKLLTKLLDMLIKNMQRNSWPVTFSIGAVTFRTPPESVHEMIQRADEIMYSVKESGKNRLRQEELAA